LSLNVELLQTRHRHRHKMLMFAKHNFLASLQQVVIFFNSSRFETHEKGVLFGTPSIKNLNLKFMRYGISATAMFRQGNFDGSKNLKV
jgi:hypothetical protein